MKRIIYLKEAIGVMLAASIVMGIMTRFLETLTIMDVIESMSYAFFVFVIIFFMLGRKEKNKL